MSSVIWNKPTLIPIGNEHSSYIYTVVTVVKYWLGLFDQRDNVPAALLSRVGALLSPDDSDTHIVRPPPFIRQFCFTHLEIIYFYSTPCHNYILGFYLNQIASGSVKNLESLTFADTAVTESEWPSLCLVSSACSPVQRFHRKCNTISIKLNH